METLPITENLAAIEGRSGTEQKTTVDLRLCRVCLTEMRDHDKFCRKCGARQTGAIAPTANTSPSPYATSRLQADTFNSVSASLLNAIAAGAQAGTSQLDSPCARRAVSALIVTLPINWQLGSIKWQLAAEVLRCSVLGEECPIEAAAQVRHCMTHGNEVNILGHGFRRVFISAVYRELVNASPE